MTLLEIANYACSKINQTDAGDILAAKNFCRRQFTLIWQSQLWKDSLIEFTQTLGVLADYVVTDTWLPTKQILLCPTLLSHVIAVRNADRKFNVQSSELFYCQDFDQFQNSGTAVDYRLLSPCVWEFNTAQTLYRRVLNTADLALAVTVDVFRPATNVIARVTGTSLGLFDRVDTFTKPVTTGDVAIGGALTVYNLPGGGQIGVAINSNADADFTAVADGGSLDVNANVGDTIYISNQIPASGGGTVGEVVGGATITSPFGVLTYNNNTSGRTFVAGSEIITAAAADTAAAKRQRIQLIGNLETGMVLRVLGKRTCPTFTADTDEPGLTGVDNVLMALVHADMLERERHYGQAKLIFDKAGVMMEVLVKEQTVQQAHQKRIIPSDGFGSCYGFEGQLGTKSNP